MISENSIPAANNQSFEQRELCTYLSVSYVQEDDQSVFAINVLLIVVNIILCACATVLNALVIIAIKRNHSLHCPTNYLLCCLACSDLLTGALVQSSYAAAKIAEIYRNSPVFCVAFAVADFVAWVAVGASILTLTAVSLERLISVQWPLRCEVFVTKDNLYAIIASVWLVPVMLQCLRVWVLSRETITIVYLVAVSTCIVVTSASYCFVWKVLRRHQHQVTNQLRLRHHFHGGRKDAAETINKRKSVVTMVYVYVLFLLSCIPSSYSLYIFKESGFHFSARSSNLWGISSTVAFTNSSLNPLVYCWRMTHIRRAILHILNSVKEHFSPASTRVETLPTFRHTASSKWTA